MNQVPLSLAEINCCPSDRAAGSTTLRSRETTRSGSCRCERRAIRSACASDRADRRMGRSDINGNRHRCWRRELVRRRLFGGWVANLALGGRGTNSRPATSGKAGCGDRSIMPSAGDHLSAMRPRRSTACLHCWGPLRRLCVTVPLLRSNAFGSRAGCRQRAPSYYECSLRGRRTGAAGGSCVSLNSSASCSVMAPPSSSASTMVTARR